MHLSRQDKQQKLAELCAAEGFASLEEMLEAVVGDSVSPAICMNCGATTEMEPDQDAGYCDGCGENRVVATLVLAGLI